MKYAAKLLTQSDLTLFEAFYRQNRTSKQKGVNLNGDVLAGAFYPSLPRAVSGTAEVPVTLDVYGPNAAPLQRLRRKIIKPEGGKNWRLNGKLVEEPANEPGRYSHLSVDDIAVIGFEGEGQPTALSLVLLSQNAPADIDVRSAILRELKLVPRANSMATIPPYLLQDFVDLPPAGHPIRLLLPDSTRDQDLADAVSGTEEAGERLFERAQAGKIRPVSAAELVAANVRAQEIGRAGEVLFGRWLDGQKAIGSLRGFTWESDRNAVSPYDFTIDEISGTTTLVDVKSTSGKFSTDFHISASELKTAAAGVAEYHIVRVYGVDSTQGARFKRSEDIRDIAARVIDGLHGLPAGVRIASVELDPELLKWGSEHELPSAEDDEG